MVITAFWPLAAFAAVATISPGGATTLATASGAHFGFRRSIPLLAGITTGLAALAAAAAAGLAGLLLAAPSLQMVMKTLGSLYLIWLAWKIARSGAPHLKPGFTTPTRFLGGVWMLCYNPKAWAMTVSAAASFSALASAPSRLAALLALSFGIACAVSLSLWCLAGQVLARLLRSPAQWRVLNGVLGLLVVASVVPIWL